MKFYITLIFLTSTLGYGQDIKYLSVNHEFKNSETAYLFGDDVKLREQPNTESNVLSLLQIGEEIGIIEKTDKTMLFDGLESPWYKVMYKDKTGYILSGLISLDKVNINNLTYLISLKKEGLKLFIKTRVIEGNEEYIENTSQLLTGEFSIGVYGNRGIESIKSVFAINYLAEACGVNGGGIYLFFNGIELIKAIDFTQVGDADLYWYIEEYIFPNDEGGKKGKIIYKREVGENKDYDTEWVETKITQRILEWKDNQIYPNIQNED